jgi:hypothetical protein
VLALSRWHLGRLVPVEPVHDLHAINHRKQLTWMHTNHLVGVDSPL